MRVHHCTETAIQITQRCNQNAAETPRTKKKQLYNLLASRRNITFG
jgi:hypothetical protein